MAESFSVKAILSAKDSGFSSTLKKASSTISSIDKKISGMAFGFMAGIGVKAFSKITSAASDLVGEISSSNAAWKTFSQNMTIAEKNGIKLEGSIDDIKKNLQDYAAKTVYSASDMAQTYAQLAAVGVEGTTELVKGFGGLAAAAENPSQAMKTLSQQGVQMAAKPTVAWQDFKLMLEQSPAGMAAVAKKMGMTTAELVTAVQDGKVKTQAFFDTIKEVGGTGSDFEKMATEFKTVEQAIDGTKDALGNKLGPALEVLNKEGIGIVNKFGEAIDGIDAEKAAASVSSIVDKVKDFGEKCTPYIDAFKEAFDGVGTAVGDAFSAVRDSLAELNGEFGSAENVDKFKGVMSSVADAIVKVANFITEHSDTIAKLIKLLPKVAAGFIAFKAAKTVAPFVSTFASGIGKIASKVSGGLASKLSSTAAAQQTVGATSASTSGQILSAAKAFALMGVGVLLIAAGFALLAFSAIQLAAAGGPAIAIMAAMVLAVVGLGVGMAALMKSLAPMSGQLMPVATAFLAMGAAVLLIAVGFAILAAASIALANAGGAAIAIMVGMVAAIALLAVGAALLGTSLTAGAVGFIAFGAAVLMVGAGFALIGVAALLAATALQMIATTLPLIAAIGLEGAVNIALLGVSLYAFALGAIVAGAAAIVLGAGLLLMGTGILLAGTGMLLLGTGALLAATALQMITAILPVITQYGLSGAAAIAVLGAGLLAFGAGALVAGAGAIVLGAGLAVVAVAIALIGVGIAVLAVGIAALAIGFLAASISIMVASAALAILNLALPLTMQYGTTAAVAMLALSVGLLALGAGALVAGAGLVVFSAGVLVAVAGIIIFGAEMAIAAAGMLVLAAGLKAVNSSMKSIAKNAKSAEKSIKSMSKSVNAVEKGLDAIGDKAKSAINKLTSAFDNSASKIQASGQKAGTGYAKGLQNGLQAAPVVATTIIVAVNMRLLMGVALAYSAGANISRGFAQGMLSQLAIIRSAAAQMAVAADQALRAKAKIHSPSDLTDDAGGYFGDGWVNGILGKVKEAKKAVAELVYIPQVATPKLAYAYSGELSSDYEYSQKAEYHITVVSELDGREVARAEAPYIQDELNKRQTRENRKKGRT